jgi:hypothetical protein
LQTDLLKRDLLQFKKFVAKNNVQGGTFAQTNPYQLAKQYHDKSQKEKARA